MYCIDVCYRDYVFGEEDRGLTVSAIDIRSDSPDVLFGKRKKAASCGIRNAKSFEEAVRPESFQIRERTQSLEIKCMTVL